jgi:hypothetical protein
MQKTGHLFLLLFVMVLVGIASPIFGQSHDTAHNDGHEFKKFRMAVNLGHAYIPSASFGNDRDFAVIPVWGLDFQYWFNPKWGLALKNDIEIAKYTINNSDDHADDLERTNPIIISLPILYSPWNNGLTFLLGPGIELEGHQNFSVFRFGLGYEFEFGNHWDFAPEFVYDLKDGHINSLTIAIGIGKRF